jgi:hypothetical protein
MQRLWRDGRTTRHANLVLRALLQEPPRTRSYGMARAAGVVVEKHVVMVMMVQVVVEWFLRLLLPLVVVVVVVIATTMAMAL